MPAIEGVLEGGLTIGVAPLDWPTMKLRFGYSGGHLFDRKSGLNILLDEISVDRSKWSLAPRYVSIALTNACELACPYCYASKAPARLSPKAVVGWARELDQAGCFGLGFGGGEPTLFPGFVDLCRDVHETTELAVTMTTHGHRFNRSLVDGLTGNVEFIRLSMDGIGPTYERLRGRPFAVFKEKLLLVKATARFGINYVVNNETIGDLARAADFAFENTAEELLLLPELTPDGRNCLSNDVIESLSAWVQANYHHCRLATSAQGSQCIDAPILMTNSPLHGSYDFVHIDAQSNLKASAFTASGVKLDDEDSIIEAIERLRHSEKSQNRETKQ